MRRENSLWPLGALLVALAFILVEMQTRLGSQSEALADPELLEPAAFPPDLVEFTPSPLNPVFTAAGAGHWDAKIRERGWILKRDDHYDLWYTGYDGTREGVRQLGYANSDDGLHWTRHPDNPLLPGEWVEDMMVVPHDGALVMFAEGRNDQGQWLTSQDGIHWQREGTLDIRYTTGKPLTPGPFGTPTAWFESGVWYLFYERRDAGVWLATSRDLRVWTNVQDTPVLVPGPDDYDKLMIALNQIVKRDGIYYAYYHGSGTLLAPRTWTTDVARSTDLLHWQKFQGNPLVAGNKSSGILVPDGSRFRLYTMHDQVDVYVPRHP